MHSIEDIFLFFKLMNQIPDKNHFKLIRMIPFGKKILQGRELEGKQCSLHFVFLLKNNTSCNVFHVKPYSCDNDLKLI